MFSTNSRGSVASTIIGVFALIAIVGASFPSSTFAATLLSESFGTGSSVSDIPSWEEQGNDSDSDALAQASGSGEDSASPDGGRFAKIGEDEWICKQIDAAGYTSLQLSYYWRGDNDAESTDRGYVEYKTTGNCDSGSWTQLQNHDLSVDNSWSTQSAFSLPAALNNTTFNVRFRTDSNSSDEYFRVDGVALTGNSIPVDTDGDTVADSSDNCPSVSNVAQTNTDGDAQGDACDTDDDGDGDADGSDNCPIVANADQADSDGDSIGNECDETPYTDEQLCEQEEGMSWVEGTCVEDEVPPTAQEICEVNGGSWIEGVCLPDACPDIEGFQPPLTDCDGDEQTEEELCEELSGMSWVEGQCVADEPTPIDTDEDGVADESDNCDSIANADQADTDEDGIGDACDSNEGEEQEGTEANTDESDDSPNPSRGAPSANARNGGWPPGYSSTGEVLGASTSAAAACTPPLNSFMGLNHTNDSAQVKVLQEFLNKELSLDIEVNGEFDRPTLDAVKAFQLKYAEEILAPWVPFGLRANEPTGFVYKTTIRMISKITCGTEIPMPELP